MFWKNIKRLKTVDFFCKVLHPRCLTEFWIRLWLLTSMGNSKNVCFVLFQTSVIWFHHVSFNLIFLKVSRRERKWLESSIRKSSIRKFLLDCYRSKIFLSGKQFLVRKNLFWVSFPDFLSPLQRSYQNNIFEAFFQTIIKMTERL